MRGICPQWPELPIPRPAARTARGARQAQPLSRSCRGEQRSRAAAARVSRARASRCGHAPHARDLWQAHPPPEALKHTRGRRAGDKDHLDRGSGGVKRTQTLALSDEKVFLCTHHRFCDAEQLQQHCCASGGRLCRRSCRVGQRGSQRRGCSPSAKSSSRADVGHTHRAGDPVPDEQQGARKEQRMRGWKPCAKPTRRRRARCRGPAGPLVLVSPHLRGRTLHV